MQANIAYVNNTFCKNMWQSLIQEQRFEGIFISKKKNGDFFYDKKVITVIKDKDQNPIYYLAMCFDVTKVKKALKTKA